MLPYLSILFLLIYLIVKYDIKGYPLGKDKWVNAFMILLILLAGLRYHIGSDTVAYESWFDDASSIQEIYRDADMWSQPLWLLLLSIVKTLTGSFVVFQFVHAIIFNILLFRFLKRTTDKIFTALFFILCVAWWHMSFEELRESLCVAIYLNALLCLKDRKFLLYVLLGFIMMGLHNFSFAIMIITPFMVFVKEKISVPIIIVIALIIFYSSSFMNMIEVVSPILLGDSAMSHVDSYLYYSETYGSVQNNLLGLLRILLTSIILPIITIIYNQSNEDMKFYNRILPLIIVFGALQTKLVIFYRFLNYFDIVLIICFVHILYHENITKPIIRIGFYMLVSIFFYFGSLNFYRPSAIEHRANIKYNCVYIPYKTIFQDPDPVREALLY